LGCEEAIKKTNYVNFSDVPFTPAVNGNSGRASLPDARVRPVFITGARSADNLQVRASLGQAWRYLKG